MSRTLLITVFTALAVLLGIAIYMTYSFFWGSAASTPQQDFYFSPDDQQIFSFDSRGSMGMMGRGMMEEGMPMPGGMMGYYDELTAVLSHEDARNIADSYVSSLENSDLEIDHFEEYSHNFYVSLIESSTGRGAVEIIIDRYSGQVQQEPQSIMWNEKYGMIRRDQQEEMTLSEQQAVERTQNFLDEAYPGTEAGQIVAYYGYYTIMTMHEGRHYGMLSVNGRTGEVWYHTWHGMFISDLAEHE